LVICLVIIGSVWINQKNIIEFNRDNLINKLAYGRSVFESTIFSSIEQIENLSKTPLLLEAVKEVNKDNLNILTKSLYINSKNFRRILVTAENGDLVSIYPDVVISYQNLSFREYFVRVKETKTTYLSDLFETATDGQKTFVVVVATPILDKEKNLAGVLVCSIDLNKLSDRLQKIATDSKGEYFEVIDQQTRKIITPGYSYTQESNMAETDLINQGLTGKYGVDEIFEDGMSLLVVHDQIRPKGWKILLKQPYLNSLRFNKEAILFILFSALGANILVILINLTYLRKKEV